MNPEVSQVPLAALGAGRWPQRLARSVVFALVGVGLAVVAHRLGGGMAADLRVDVAGGFMLLLLGLALTGKEQSGRAIGAIVLISQLLLHVGFTASAPMAHMPATFSVSGLVMLVAHLAAAAATAWWLRRGERAAWALILLIVATALPTLIAFKATERRSASVTGRPWAPAQPAWAAPLSGRGPPMAAVIWSITA